MTLGSKTCFSHFGEDQIVAFLLQASEKTGSYCDIGCYHPTLYSNTYFFYQAGWRGVLVDANPFMVELCKTERPEDTALNLAVGERIGRAKLYRFNDWGSSNTIDPTFRDRIAESQNETVSSEINLGMVTLESLFESHFEEKQIDFLNIDIENVDLIALKSNNWAKYRPRVIAVEDLELDMKAPIESRIFRYLNFECGYRLVSKAMYTSIYIDDAAAGSLSL